jgi:predicted Zn-dependent protease
MWRSGASEAIGRCLPPSGKNLRSFTPVNLKDSNAFALPGGPMFVQRGMFDAAAEEAAVAGVMAHELGAQIMARAGYDPRALAHPPSRSASIPAQQHRNLVPNGAVLVHHLIAALLKLR